MGEAIEYFRDMNEYRKQERADLMDANIASLKTSGIDFTEQSKGVIRITVERGVVMYYPSSNKWQYKGKVMHGGVPALVAYLLNQHGVKSCAS